MPKIGICGTQSCGKTTLVKALSQLPEFKDYYLATERSKYLRDLGIPLNTDSSINGQTIFLAERASELIHPNLITDRTVIDVMAFTSLAKSINFINKDLFKDYASIFIEQYDYIFYISPEGIDIEDNQIRETDPIYRMDIDKKIQEIITTNSHKIKNLIKISGTTEERVNTIKEVLSM